MTFVQMFLIFGMFSTSCLATIMVDYHKYIRADCKSTGNVCSKPYCSVKTISRFESFANFGCETFNGPINPMLYSIIIAVKPIGWRNFRSIFQFTNVDVCDLLSHPEKYPILESGIKKFDRGFPGMIQKCPYKTLRVANATFGPPHENADRFVDFKIFPNGIYNLTFSIADHASKPKNTISVNLYIESRARYKNFETIV